MRKNAKTWGEMRKNAIKWGEMGGVARRKNAKKCEKMRIAFPPPRESLTILLQLFMLLSFRTPGLAVLVAKAFAAPPST